MRARALKLALEKSWYYRKRKDEIVEQVMQHGNLPEHPRSPEAIRNVFVVAGDIHCGMNMSA